MNIPRGDSAFLLHFIISLLSLSLVMIFFLFQERRFLETNRNINQIKDQLRQLTATINQHLDLKQ